MCKIWFILVFVKDLVLVLVTKISLVPIHVKSVQQHNVQNTLELFTKIFHGNLTG